MAQHKLRRKSVLVGTLFASKKWQKEGKRAAAESIPAQPFLFLKSPVLHALRPS